MPLIVLEGVDGCGKSTQAAGLVLGLRAMYFLLAAAAARFHLLAYGLAAVLVFVGGKMLLADLVAIPAWASLLVVTIILAVTMVWSHLTADRVAGATAAS